MLRSQFSTESSRLLRTKIERFVLQASRSLPEGFLLILVVYSQDSGNTLSNDSDLGELACSSSGDFGHAKLPKLILKILELLQQLILLLASQLMGLNLDYLGQTQLTHKALTHCARLSRL